jgi:glycosyltransferase involved in cell wall biosynthesis
MKALILAYDFPPFVSVGGARPYSWYRYFREYGVDPIVVTRQWENRYRSELDYVAPSRSPDTILETSDFGTIIRTPYFPNLSNRLLLRYGAARFGLIRKVITGYYEVAQYYANVGPKCRLYFAARRYLREGGADAIVATGEPFVLFRYASSLSAEFGVPWLADYRDPWSSNKGRAPTRVSRKWHALLEMRFTRSASAVSTVSSFFAQQLLGVIPGRPLHIVPNGFDPEAMANAHGVKQGHRYLTVAFSGSIYGWHPVESFLRVCAELAAEIPLLRVEFVGINDRTRVETFLATYHPSFLPAVAFLPRMANNEMACTLAHANLLLAFNYYSYAGTKIYDYLAVRRRILMCYTDDPEGQALKEKHYNLSDVGSSNNQVLQDIIESTCSGVAVRDAAHLRESLRAAYQEFQRAGSVSCDSQGVEKYSRRFAARLMASAVIGVAGRGAAG